MQGSVFELQQVNFNVEDFLVKLLNLFAFLQTEEKRSQIAHEQDNNLKLNIIYLNLNIIKT